MTYYDTMVLSGGAVKGSLILGGLQYCCDHSLIDGITYYVGTSVGAIISYLLCIGCTPTEIIVCLCTHPIFKAFQLDVVGMLESVMNHEGIMSFAPITEWLERITIEKVGKLLTMGDIRTKFNKNLAVVTYNYSKQQIEYITSDNRPDMPCIIALKMSCAIPVIFGSFKYEEQLYIDGAICDHFAITYRFPSQTTSNRIGFVINPESTITEEEDTSAGGIISYIYNIMTIPIMERYKSMIAQESDADVIKLHTSVINTLDFTASSNTLLELFSEGYNQTKAFFEHQN